jgi:hypothetical protein
VLNTEVALRRLQQVRDVAHGPQSAYLMRTRLNRMLLSLQRQIARDSASLISTPVEDLVPSDANLQPIARLCNEIVAESSHLSRRSEALDERWESSWTLLRTQLDRLELLLLASRTGSESPETIT